MCDVMNSVPGGTCLTESTRLRKPITDFAIHPDNGTLYVMERPNYPYETRIQMYDVTGPTAVSQGTLREWPGRSPDTLEFFPR